MQEEPMPIELLRMLSAGSGMRKILRMQGMREWFMEERKEEKKQEQKKKVYMITITLYFYELI